MKTFWYFGGYNKHNFNVAFKYFKSPVDAKELYNVYRKIGNRDVLYFNYLGKNAEFKVLELDKNKEGSEEDEEEAEEAAAADEEYEGY
jgi:hypothetical protein